MPYQRPSLTALRNQAIQDITASGVPGLTGLLRNAVLRVLAWCMAALAYSVYGYADWIARMSVPFTAQDEFLYAWAALVGIYPKEATAANGQATFTGALGTLLPAETPLARQDGTTYQTTADGTIDDTGNVTVRMVATVLGEFTNCDAGTAISISTPVAGINSNGLTVGPTTGGADQETQEQLRSRMLFRYRQPPQGGARSDYVEWASEVPGVTRAWAASFVAGTVTVGVMFDGNGNEGFPNGTNGTSRYEVRPSSTGVATGDQLIVADHIYPLQPVTALVQVFSPVAYPVNITLTQLTPNTAEVRGQIVAALNDMFLMEAVPGGTIWPSQLYDAINAVQGVEHFTILVPSAPVEPPSFAYLPVLGSFSAPP
jgi:uncharacterized phage protein gp47/JayE